MRNKIIFGVLFIVAVAASFYKLDADNTARENLNRPDEVATATLIELSPAQPIYGIGTYVTSVGDGVAHRETVTGFTVRETGATFPVYLYDGKAYGQKKNADLPGSDGALTLLAVFGAFTGVGAIVCVLGFLCFVVVCGVAFVAFPQLVD